MAEKAVLTVKDMADLLGISTNAVYVLVHRKRIPYRKFGRRVVFLREEIEEFFKSLPKEEPFRL